MGILKPISDLFGKVASTTLATFSALSCIVFTCTAAVAQQPTVRWIVDPSDDRSAYVEVQGAADSNAQKNLSVRPQSAPADAPSMLGSYRTEQGSLKFQPQFSLERGITYRAVYRSPSGSEVVSTYEVPAGKTTPSTVVKTVYPSAEVVPENLLKFYIHFSAPMSRGDIYDYIHLLDAQGKEIELPFLRLAEELWDPGMTRVTVLFDPGRIKRGVMPQQDIGPALIEGKKISLVIDTAWKDATGLPLKESFRKDFTVGPADRTMIDAAKWKFTPPKSGTRDPIRIEFGEAMESALALRMIGIVDGSGKLIEGDASLDDHERRWSFAPDQTWLEGFYRIVIRTTIEDLAGNNIGKAFDVDLANNEPRSLDAPTVSVRFEVR